MTVIVPCRNEAAFIGPCLESIIANDYPKGRLEVLVVDGMSDDRTSEIIDTFSTKDKYVKRISNVRKITPVALNLGIHNASGEIIVRVDAHARIAPDYLRRCVEGLAKHNADNVGGTMKTVPNGEGLVANAISVCMSHPFGVGNSHFRMPVRNTIITDTIFGGCYRKAIFEEIGLFNERLERTQDMEFNQRLRKAGGRIVLDPEIKCFYYASRNLKSFVQHNFHDGLWAVLPFAYSNIRPVQLRHLVPMLFVLALASSIALGLWLSAFRLLLATITTVYAGACLASSTQIAWSRRDLRYVIVMPIVFAARHFAYGLGSLRAVMKLAWSRSFMVSAPSRTNQSPPNFLSATRGPESPSD